MSKSLEEVLKKSWKKWPAEEVFKGFDSG